MSDGIGHVEQILLMEDNHVLRRTMGLVLTSHGYQVHEARDGIEGMEVFRQYHELLDLVLTDANMPRMGAQELIHLIQLLHPGMPILVCSVSGTYDPNVLIGAGATRILDKPMPLYSLVTVVRQTIHPLYLSP